MNNIPLTVGGILLPVHIFHFSFFSTQVKS
uniref:Uncharacterized protein n=1 Tax=Anguilla anguilla TaxID=7936 RepID=A0A0E9SWP8_ANGAN